MENRIANALAASAIAAWSLGSLSLILASLSVRIDFVPMYFHEWILWPNTMTFGAMFAVAVVLFFRQRPGLPAIAGAIYAGSAVGMASLYVTTEVEFLMCVLITAVLAATLARRALTGRRFTALNGMVFAIYAIYGAFVLADHQVFLFPVYDAVQEERRGLIAKAADSPDPLGHAICQDENVECFVFDPGERHGLSERDMQILQDVHDHRPHGAALVTLTTMNILNNKTDTTYAAMRHEDGRTFVVLSGPKHMLEWRLIAAKYLIIWSSLAFLVLFSTLVPAGWHLSRERGAAEASA